MKTKNKITYALAVVMVALLVIFSSLWGGGAAISHAAISAYAAENSDYSNVMDDLLKDGSFDEAAYPAKANDYSLDVIQVAESTDGEVLIYVYQPCAGTLPFTATTVRLSTTIGDNLNPRDYELTLLNRQGVFAKYLVNDITVKPDVVRYYDITAIHRKWIYGIDEPAQSSGNTVNEVVYKVAKLFTACTLDGKVTYTETHTEVIEITNKRVGFIRYFEGYYIFGKTLVDCHYVAFDTDRQIDKLYEADLSYHYQPIITTTDYITSENPFVPTQSFTHVKNNGDGGNTVTTLKCDDNVYVQGQKHSWVRIQSVDEFIETEIDLTDEAKAELQGNKWVLRFAETPFVFNATFTGHKVNSTQISEVTILRLYFDTNGDTYNLGVVDNKQTGSGKFDNIITFPGKGGCTGIDWQVVIGVLGLIFILWVLKITGLLELFCKGVIWVVTLPFKLIGKLFKRKKE